MSQNTAFQKKKYILLNNRNLWMPTCDFFALDHDRVIIIFFCK